MTGGDKPSPTHLGTSPTETQCENLTHSGQLSSPKPQEVEKLQVGDVLEVGIDDGITVVLSRHGQPIGNLPGAPGNRLLHCIKKGYDYIATITHLQDGKCQIKVEPNR